MIRINLLAAERPSQKKKAGTPGAMQAYLLLGLFAGGALALSGVAWFLKSSEIAEVQAKLKTEEATKARLQTIKQQVDALQAKETTLKQKVKLIEDLQAAQGGAVRLLDEMSKALPDFVWLTNVDQAGAGMKITGESSTYGAMADFMKNLQKAAHPGQVCEKPNQQDRTGCWFPNVDLVSSTETNNIVTFNLQATFAPPAPPAPGAPPGPAAAPPKP